MFGNISRRDADILNILTFACMKEIVIKMKSSKLAMKTFSIMYVEIYRQNSSTNIV